METLKRNWIFSVTLGFLVGVAIASIFPSLALGGFFLVLGIATFVYGKFFIEELKTRSVFVLIALTFIFSFLGVWRFVGAELPFNAELESQLGSKINESGVVIREPRDRESYREYVVEIQQGAKLLVRAGPFPQYEFADRLNVKGKLEKPKPFETDSGRVFDYEKYLAKEGISYIVSFAEVEKVGEENKPIRKALFSLKNKFISSFEKVINYPESSLLAGILLGADDSMGKDLSEAFRIVGIIHIVVLSGYNITIVADSVKRFFSFLSRRFVLGFSALGIVLFVVMVGMGPSVVRAGTMALLVLFAGAVRRKYDVGRALLVAGALMVLWNPMVLLFDLGFQLSFLATIAIIWIAPKVKEKLKFIPEKAGLREIASATIATQIFVLPLLLYSSGLLSISGLIVNMLVLPLIPTVMFLGFITGLLGFIHFSLAFLPGLLSNWLLSYVIWISEHVSKIPGSAISLSVVPVWVPILIYAGFGVWVILKNRRSTSAKVGQATHNPQKTTL